jgi:hypothetical protein
MLLLPSTNLAHALWLVAVVVSACAPLRPPKEERTAYGSNEGKEERTPVAAIEPDYTPPMGWQMITSEECGISFALPGQPKRAEQAASDGVHAVYSYEVDADTQLVVECSETPGAPSESVAALRDQLAKQADDGIVDDLGPWDVGDAHGHGFQLKVRGKVHRQRVIILGGRRVQLTVTGTHEYPGLAESLHVTE